MAFKKLEGCDSSDLELWANSAPARNFIREVNDVRAVALRELVKKGAKNREESASIVRSFDLVIGLFEEAAKG